MSDAEGLPGGSEQDFLVGDEALETNGVDRDTQDRPPTRIMILDSGRVRRGSPTFTRLCDQMRRMECRPRWASTLPG